MLHGLSTEIITTHYDMIKKYLRNAVGVLALLCLLLIMAEVWQRHKIDEYVEKECTPNLYWEYYFSQLENHLSQVLSSHQSIYVYLYADANQLARNFSIAGRRCVAFGDARQIYSVSVFGEKGRGYFSDEVRAQCIESWTSLSNGFAVFCETLAQIESKKLYPDFDEDVYRYLTKIKHIVEEIEVFSEDYVLSETICSEDDAIAYLAYFEDITSLAREFRTTAGSFSANEMSPK